MEEDIDQVGAAECRGDFHRTCQQVLMLARREAAGETATWSSKARRRATTLIPLNADDESCLISHSTLGANEQTAGGREARETLIVAPVE